MQMSESIVLSDAELAAAEGLADHLLARAESDVTVAFVAAVAVSGHLVLRGQLEANGALPTSTMVVLSARSNEVGPRLLERIVVAYRAVAPSIPRGDMYSPAPGTLVRAVGAEVATMLTERNVDVERRAHVAAEAAVRLAGRLPQVSAEAHFIQSITSTLVETSKTWYGVEGKPPKEWLYSMVLPLLLMAAVAGGVYLFGG